jgi:hypothetical protein
MESLSDIALRMIAAFYAFVMFLGVRKLAMDRLLDNAIAAITLKKDKSPQARGDRLRWQMMMLIFVLGAPACILVAGMISAGIPLLIAVNILSLANMGVVMPKFVDPYEPPHPIVRRNSWIATLVFLLFSLWVLLHWRNGNMTGIADTHLVVLAAVIAAIAAFAFHTVTTLRKTRFGGLGGSNAWSADGDETRDEERRAAEEAEREAYRGVKLVLRPALGESPLFRADTGEALPYDLPIEELTYEMKEDLRRWQTDLQGMLDHHDPRRARFRDAQSQAEITERGEQLHKTLIEILGAERIGFDPSLRPSAPQFAPSHIVIQARVREWPTADPERPEDPIYPADLGISLQLENEFLDWSYEYDEAALAAASGEFLSGKPNWSREQWEAFETRGKALAERLRVECAATGRSDIVVSYRDPEIGPDAPR